ncbi:rRNA maturation RNase YbeY [Clostridia bacterium]|nr:rRNA maturation RNase YbeY [Clostridia bacterium]
MNLILTNQQNNPIPDGLEETLTSLLEHTLEVEKLEGDFEVGITFVDDDEIQRLNRDYRNKDQVTDVLSFAMSESLEDEPEIINEDMSLLGDIVIDYQQALKQAKEYEHSTLRELCYLALHGMLHLLGYDHEKEEDKKRMRKQEEAVLDAFKIKREL